jgi:hypothetical protein
MGEQFNSKVPASRTAVEVTLANELRFMARADVTLGVLGGFVEEILKTRAEQALPDSSEQDRAKFIRYWRKRFQRERKFWLRQQEHERQRGATELGGNEPARPEAGAAVNASDGKGTDRRAAVDAFILKCNQETALKVTRKHIWRAAQHKTARQFQYWQASDPKATTQDDQSFRRILVMSTKEFIALLKKKNVIT